MNRVIGDVGLTVDGADWTLRFDFNALCAFEEKVGVAAPARIAAMEVGQGTALDLRGLIWALLQRHHSGISPLGVGELIDAAPHEWAAAMRDALAAAAPKYDPTGKPTAARHLT